MSITPIGGRLFDGSGQKITTATLREHKLRHEPITCLTAYDYASARLVDAAGIDMVLVGDSLAQTMLGYENTLSVTMDEMLHHVKAVRRGLKNAQRSTSTTGRKLFHRHGFRSTGKVQGHWPRCRSR